MKLLFALVIAIGAPAAAQDKEKKAAKKVVVRQKAHTKATPEQVRRFNQLQEQQKR